MNPYRVEKGDYGFDLFGPSGPVRLVIGRGPIPNTVKTACLSFDFREDAENLAAALNLGARERAEERSRL